MQLLLKKDSEQQERVHAVRLAQRVIVSDELYADLQSFIDPDNIPAAYDFITKSGLPVEVSAELPIIYLNDEQFIAAVLGGKGHELG